MEQLAAMQFAKLKETTEKNTAAKVKDVVVSVPGWFTESQRRALLDSIHISGMNCLRIVNDLTAVSLNWGLYKMDLDEKEPKRVMIIDIGEHAMSVGITEFTKSQAKVVSTAYNTSVSGRAADLAMANHFANEFQAKRKVDLRQHPKSWFRLCQAMARTKKILNTNPTGPLNVECIYEEYDITSTLTRDVYAELIKDVLVQVPVALDAALTRAGLTVDQLHSIEIVGSASRTTLFQNAISAHLKRELSTTMNAEEAVAKGCALQCAILSPHFRVREYSLIDVVDHPVVVSWNSLGDKTDEKHVTIFSRTSTWPAAKNVNFHRPQAKPVEIRIHYDQSESVPKGINPLLSTIVVDKIPQPAEGPDAEIRLKIRKNINGLLDATECELVEKYEEVETPAADANKMDVDAKPAEPAAEGAAAPAAEAAPAAAATTEPVKKKKVRYTTLPFQVSHTYINSPTQLADWVKAENKMAEETRITIAVQDAKNAVEAYVYDSRDKLCASWATYVNEADAAAFNTLLDETGDWLYGEGENQTKEVYEKKLLSLKALGEPIAIRLYEAESRAQALTSFDKAHAEYAAKVADNSEKYDHITAEDRAKVTAEIEKNQTWLEPLRQKQAGAALTDDPVFYSRDLQSRVESLAKMADAIFNKPKPKPKPVETPKPAETTPNAEQPQAQPENAAPAPEGTQPAAEQAPQPEGEKMEVD